MTENGQKPQGRWLKKKPLPTVPVVLSTIRALESSPDSDHYHGQSGRGLQTEERIASPDSGHEQPAETEEHTLHARESPYWGSVPGKGHAELTRMIGYLTLYALDDWSLVLEVCDRASTSEGNAKEAVRALRREFKYGKPPTQLSAARLWAIMLRDSSDVFILQSTSRKFLGVVENLIQSNETSPVVRERLLDVVAAAAHASSSKKASERGFKALWRRVKPSHKPDEGVPLDVDDAMFNPPESGYWPWVAYAAQDQVACRSAGTSISGSPTYANVSSPIVVTPGSQTQYQSFSYCLERAESWSLPVTPPSSRPPLPLPPGAASPMPYQLVRSTGSVPELNCMLHEGYLEPYPSASPTPQHPQDPRRQWQGQFPLLADAGTLVSPLSDLSTPASPPPRYSQLFNIG